jgi:hypothetical protein
LARALSSAGRALLSQSRSHRFKSCSAHIKAATRPGGLRFNFMKISKCVAGLCVCAWAAATAADYEAPGVAGDITADTTWSGDVYLAGDLFIAPGATLTLEPGTRVTVSREDALSGRFIKHGTGYDVEVVVAGALNVRGARDALVVFAPEDDGSPDDKWAGFKLEKGGSLAADGARFVGLRWPLPSAAALSGDVYAVEETRKSGSAYLPYRGHDGKGKSVSFYPDGTLMPKVAVKANRGYSRWIIAPAMVAAFIPLSFLAAIGPGFEGRDGEATAIMVIGPPLGFGLGYIIGWGIDTDWGARRAQDKWLAEHPDFTPLF